MHIMKPPVHRLAVHLPREQQVVFNDDRAIQRVLDNGPPTTTLTAFFDLCANDATAPDPPLLYPDVVERYTWHSSGCCLRARQRSVPYCDTRRSALRSQNCQTWAHLGGCLGPSRPAP
jgi:hypothetical protein